MKTLLFVSAALLSMMQMPPRAAAVVETSRLEVPLTTTISNEVPAHVVEIKLEPTAVRATSTSAPVIVTKLMFAEISTTTTSDPCDLECTKMDLNPICATNMHCVHEFPNECVMLTYNCRHDQQPFKIFKYQACDELLERTSSSEQSLHHNLQPSRQPRCTPEDLNGFMLISKP